MKSVFFLFLSFCILQVGNAQKERDPGTYNYEVQFIKTGLEGTELFKVFTYCKKEKDCFEYAKIDALKAILFKGIPGSGLQRPLVADPGAEDKFRDYFKTFFSEGGKIIHLSSGTGFFINNNTIITNEHVVQGCSGIKIRGAIEDSDADLIGVNKKKDLALIRTSLQSPGIAPLRGDAAIKVGEEVNVMGYPLERGIKGTYLIKKATITNNLDVYDGVERIQFTDAVEKGNSGGPLLDTSGTVIGVIVGKMSFYPAGSDTKDTLPIKTSSVAITLKDLKNFLDSYGIFFHTDNVIYKYSDSYMENKAKDYIVNVQCIKNDVAAEE